MLKIKQIQKKNKNKKMGRGGGGGGACGRWFESSHPDWEKALII